MSSVSQFFLGLSFLPKGFGFLLKRPSLWIWVLIPWLLAILVLAVSWGLFIHHYPTFYQFLLTHIGVHESTWPQGIWAKAAFALLWILKEILKVLIFLLGLILLSILSFLLYLIVASPFLDLLAEKTTLLFKKEPGTFGTPKRAWHFLGQTMMMESLKAILFLSIPLFLLILNLIPAVGGFLYTVTTCLFGMWGLGFISVDYPAGHQPSTIRSRFKFALEFKGALLGFGLPFLIPFAPLLLQAPMVVGGTLLYHELISHRE